MSIVANGVRLKTSTYQSAKRSDHPVLAVVLHGDLLGVFAHRAAQQTDNVIAAVLLRPGYADDVGDRSEGWPGDNDTADAVDAVANVARKLRDRFHPGGHCRSGPFGGSAITADLIARYPEGTNAALLVSCPLRSARLAAHSARAHGCGQQ